MHWTEPYIGTPFVLGVSDCAALTVRVQREVFGREIGLPVERAAGLRGWAAQIDDLQADYADPVEMPLEGDAVLIKLRGRFSHIGTVCRIQGELWALHTTEANGAVLQRLRELPQQQMAVAGFYRWKAR